MKKIFKTLSVCVLAVFALASCKKNDFDYDKLLEEQRIRDSIENARIEKLIEDQADELAAYVETIPEMAGAEHIDSLGIYYKVLQPGDNSSYTYKLQSNGYNLVLVHPEVTVYYSESDLQGNIFKQNETDKTATFNLAQNSVPLVWRYGIYPSSITYNDNDIKIGGFTTNGLKKGAKIRIVTSSPWGYDNVERKNGDKTLPANSPLDIQIEIVDIK